MDIRDLYIGHMSSSEDWYQFINLLCNLTKYLSEQKKKKLSCSEVWEAILKKLPPKDQWAIDLGKLADIIYIHSDLFDNYGFKPSEYSSQLLKIFNTKLVPF